MLEETFFQTFVEDDEEVTCFWGRSEGALSFFVIDETNGLHPSVKFRLQASTGGNIGVLTVDGLDMIISRTSLVVHIREEDWSKKQIPMTSASFDKYLQAGDLPLTIAAVEAYAARTYA